MSRFRLAAPPLPGDAIPVAEAAQRLGINPPAVHRWILRGIVPCWEVDGVRHVRPWDVHVASMRHLPDRQPLALRPNG